MSTSTVTEPTVEQALPILARFLRNRSLLLMEVLRPALGIENVDALRLTRKVADVLEAMPATSEQDQEIVTMVRELEDFAYENGFHEQGFRVDDTVDSQLRGKDCALMLARATHEQDCLKITAMQDAIDDLTRTARLVHQAAANYNTDDMRRGGTPLESLGTLNTAVCELSQAVAEAENARL